MNELKFLLKISRPRFWLYVFGPYIVGLLAGAMNPAFLTDLLQWKTIFFAIYFLFPANLLIYGINDIFDHDTDAENEKKSGYEARVETRYQRRLFFWILLFNLPFIAVALIFIRDATLPFIGFLFFSIFYSAPPFRAKAVPFLDSAFNILYVFPAVIAYRILAGDHPPLEAVLAAACWTAAMHAYSAVPDIDADRRANVPTIATTIGGYATLGLCSILFIAAAFISFKYLGYCSLALGAVYLTLITISFKFFRDGKLFVLYRYFPFINAAAGFALFWYVALNKFTF
jgi:4-hydroxybenzoate polyprenyltransferase